MKITKFCSCGRILNQNCLSASDKCVNGTQPKAQIHTYICLYMEYEIEE